MAKKKTKKKHESVAHLLCKLETFTPLLLLFSQRLQSWKAENVSMLPRDINNV